MIRVVERLFKSILGIQGSAARCKWAIPVRLLLLSSRGASNANPFAVRRHNFAVTSFRFPVPSKNSLFGGVGNFAASI
jgi:hypothetical protein